MNIELISIAVAIGSSLLTLLGIYLANVWRRKIQPYYCQRTDTLLRIDSVGSKEVQITHKGMPVPRLEATRLLMWNGGSESFGNGDVVEPLRIRTETGGKILDWRLVAQSVEANACALHQDKENLGYMRLDFMHMEPTHFLVVDLLHTSKSGRLDITGLIKGAKKGIKEVHILKREMLVMSVGGFVAGSIVTVSALEAAFGYGAVGYAVTLAVASLMIVMTWWMASRASLLPAQLAPFAESENSFMAPRKESDAHQIQPETPLSSTH